MPTRELTKGAQVVGPERERLQREIARAYEKGEDIRALATRYGRSYGWVHRLLSDTGVLRPRGGARRKREAQA